LGAAGDSLCAPVQETKKLAGGSASSGNLNCVSMVVTRDPERKRKIYELHFEQPMVLQAPLVITFCADWFRTREWLRLRGARDNFNNLIGYHVAAYDTMIVAQNAFLGFQAGGLGCGYMGTTLHSMTEIAAFLELPDTCVPVTTIVVGWPAEDPDKRDRLPLSAMVHDERYQSPKVEQIDKMYEEREVRGWQRYLSSVPDFRPASRRWASRNSHSTTRARPSTIPTCLARIPRSSRRCSRISISCRRPSHRPLGFARGRRRRTENTLHNRRMV